MQTDFIHRYFQAERHEMLTILAGAFIFTAASAALFAVARDSFSKPLLVTVAVIAVLLSGIALSLLHRDANAAAELSAAMASDQGVGALDAELARVAVVLSKYDGYRYFVSALGLVALAAFALTKKPWAHAIAVGLLLLVVAQVVIDHYSEHRAHRYHADLAALRRAR